MRLLADEDLHADLVRRSRSRGHDVYWRPARHGSVGGPVRYPPPMTSVLLRLARWIAAAPGTCSCWTSRGSAASSAPSVWAVIDAFSRKVLAVGFVGGERGASFAGGLLRDTARAASPPASIVTDRRP